ncbi:MAG TPA: serine/threonine-protein kinase [Pyrinomonadaceae bacterium]|nr:serine/threonine-protein kinase [Pyrinomonadaceae bacterium]
MLRPGDKVGQYVLVNKLGSGAFGAVWLGERRTAVTSTRVALKFAHDDAVDMEAVRQEADLWVRASGHPNVLPIIEADIFDGRLVIASEYAPDGSLEEWLRRHGGKAPTVVAAVEIIAGILAGLEHLHARGIIHRDLKPANILFQGEVPRVADFGISRALSATHSGGTAGTLAYMAPEAFEGTRGVQTDVWAAGVILYQLLAGHLPFPQKDLPSLLKSIWNDPPAEPANFVPVILHSIVRRALAKDPRQRFGSAAEMRAEVKSQKVMFELMIQPRSGAPKSSLPTADKAGPVDKEKDAPRRQHYHFAHVALREKAERFPKPLVDNLRGESGIRRLNFYWMSEAMAVKGAGEEFIPADGLACSAVDLSEGYYGVVVQLPQPERMAEAFFVAIILRDSGHDSNVACRYITLELGKNRDGSHRTVLGEWINGSHFGYRSGPPPEREAFIEAVRGLILPTQRD